MQLALSREKSFLLVALTTILAACSDLTAPGAGSGAATTQPPAAPGAPVAPPEQGNPLAGMTLYVAPGSQAARQAAEWRSARPADALQMDKIAAQPAAKWFGNWNADVRADVDAAVTRAAAAGSVPVLVAYNIPQRDCGGLSGGGSNSPDGYHAWIAAFAAGIGARRALVVLEPDALAGMDCLSAADQSTRTGLISYAVNALRSNTGTAVYIDAGQSHWQPAATMAARLTSAGLALANGFALNVSNFYSTAEQAGYGDVISALAGGKHYVIDTSRNGLGSDGTWCNPPGRALGERPTTATGRPLADAFLWIKTAGESDGACNGGPAAGTWMAEYALGLAQRASY